MPSDRGGLHREVRSPVLQPRSTLCFMFVIKNTKMIYGVNNTSYDLCHTSLSVFPRGGGKKYVAVLLQRARDVLGITPSPFIVLPRPHDTSNKNTADIKSPYSRRAGIISFSIINITTVIHEYHCFLHHFK